jgi:uncharacterized membrane protein
MNKRTNYRPLILAGSVLGMGLGGFFDGSVLHQSVQWHHLITVAFPPTSLENLELNTFWDGLFHAATWVLVIGGLALLWRAGQRADTPWSTRTLIGSLLMGWGLFNLVEGIIDHHLLKLHHVRPGPNQLAWDLGFLAWGAAMLIGGWLLARASSPAEGVRVRSGEDRQISHRL